MNYEWNSKIYFQRHSTFDREYLIEIANALAECGLEFKIDIPANSLNWATLKKVNRFPSLETAIDATLAHQGAVWSMHHAVSNVDWSIGIFPCSDLGLYKDNADSVFGYLGLSCNGHSLFKDGEMLSASGMRDVIHISQTVVKHTRAMYGIGDLIIRQIGGPSVYASDLLNKRTPLLGWWNYFDNEYVQHIGKERLLTASHWITYENSLGITIVTRPIEGVLHANEAQVNNLVK